MGAAKIILGVKIIRECENFTLAQEHYVEKPLNKFDYYDMTTMSTPYDGNTWLMKNRDHPIGQSTFAQIIGSLVHLMNFTRPDIAYAICIE